MAHVIIPDTKLGRQIDQASGSDTSMCWTCGSCDFECPVNIATGRLRPQKIVRMANLGMMDDLLHLPEIWYCLTCRRCMNICPNAVSPCTLIEFIRSDALFKGILSLDVLQRYHDLFTKFQRVRWHVVKHCFDAEFELLSDRMWHDWLERPVPSSTEPIIPYPPHPLNSQVKTRMGVCGTLACFTCGECSSACPVDCEPAIFDPRVLFRMINLGLIDELMRSPSLWLCIDCGRCTESCSQLVDGRQMIEQLKELAVLRNVVDRDFCLRVERANRIIYKRFLNEIDLLLSSDARKAYGSSHVSRPVSDQSSESVNERITL
jgi:heterodisulfide reductase subunit C